MCSPKCLTVLAIAALAACAAAHPGGNDIVNVSKWDLAGKSAVAPKTRNSARKKSVIERFPYAVLFLRNCGGTILSPNWVLTAAHCSLDLEKHIWHYVLAGTDNSVNGSGEKRLVKRLVIHPLFSVGPYWLNATEFDFKQVAARWDFMLVELVEPLPLNGKTMVAAKLDQRLDLPEGLNVGYAGYGTDHFGGYMSSLMQSKELEVESNEQCSKLEQYNAQDMLCAKGRAPRFDSACSGDSGSGLVDESGNLLGVVSWVENDAVDCAKGNIVVFSRVAAVRDWIRQVTKL